ncbi:MAG: hypothetical protein ACHQT9_00175 [Candidatus Saccharimonadales bacterium]
MTGMDLEPTITTVSGEVVDTTEDYIHLIFAGLGIEDALDAYLGDGPRSRDEPAVEQLLGKYAKAIAPLATTGEDIDVDIVRYAFDYLTFGMNEAANRRYGYEPRSGFQAMFARAVAKPPYPQQYIRPLDDRYWSQQFMDQFRRGDGPMIARNEGESDEQYLPRYMQSCMNGFLFAPFTLL